MIKNICNLIIISLLCITAQAQPPQKATNSNRNVPEEGVLNSGPIPAMNAYTADGKPISIQELCKGKYTVLAAGCLTCPLFHQNYPEIEAAYIDYKDKNVQFFYFYKYLRHPEMNGYVQAQNISERLLQLAEARDQLKTKVPWIADTMDDDIRIGLRSGSWSVFLISPEGEVLYGSGRIDPQGLRDALNKAVGPVKQRTQAADLDLPKIGRVPKLENIDSDWGVARPDGLKILTTIPTSAEDTYYVKLRAEADEALLKTGSGRLFLGFYPDPIHDAHWNNLAPPMRFSLSLPQGVKATPTQAEAHKGPGDSDTKPRQFWVDITSDKTFDSISLNMDYYACTSDMCLPLTHKYIIKMEDQNRGARTFGMNKGKAGKSNSSNSANRRIKRMDTNQDGSVSFEEFYTNIKNRQNNQLSEEKAQQRFHQIDKNKNGLIDLDEMKQAMANITHTKR